MNDQLTTILSRIETNQKLTGHDLRDLRFQVFDDQVVSFSEADRLFSLHKTEIEKPAGWDDFFVAVMTAILVRQSEPAGIMDKVKASWFIARATEMGFIESAIKFRILQAVLTEVRDAPDIFVEFALLQVKAALIDGRAYMGRNRVLSEKQIGQADVDIIEQILYASGHDGHVAVTQKQAEMLFDIEEICTVAEDAKDAWQSLFVNAITNSIMFFGEVREAFNKIDSDVESDNGPELEASVSDSDAQTVWESFSGQDFEEQSNRYLTDTETIENSDFVDQGEALWLAHRVAKDGFFTVNERALLRHLGKMCPEIHHSLKPFIAAAA